MVKLSPPPSPWYEVEARLRRLERYVALVACAFALAMAVLAAGGCSGVTLVRARDGGAIGDMAILQDEVMEACEILGLVCEPATKSYGAITLDIVKTNDLVRGRALSSTCRPVVRSVPDPLVIAHEFGHVLGLEHVDDEVNLMHPSVSAHGGDELEHEQRETVTEQAMLLDGCR